MSRFLALLLLAGLALSAAPAHAQLGRLVDRARDAAERTANQTTDRAAENATSGAADAAHPHRAAIEAAAVALDELWEQHYDAFALGSSSDFDYSRVDQNNWDENALTWLAALEAAEATLARAQPHMQVLHEHLGDDPSIGSGLHRLGIDQSGTPYDRFYRAAENLAQFRRDAAAGAVSNARPTMDAIEDRFFIPEIRVEKARELKATLQIARRFDAQNEELNALLAGIDVYIDEVRADVEAEIDEGQWPGHAAGAPTHLAADVLAFLRAHEEWGGKPDVEVLAVGVQGGWMPAERNLLGQVIQWRLPVVVAATNPIWRESSAARVYELSVLAQQNNPAPQAPPFVGYWVGESHLVRLDKLPSQ